MENTETKRIEWIDIAKGIAIILMVIGHANLPERIYNYIYSFHMPFFFFISGFFLKKRGFNSFMSSRLCNLVFPFIFMTLLVFTFGVIIDKTTFGIGIRHIMTRGCYGTALWFIPILFLSEIIHYLVLDFSNKYKVLIILFLALVSYFLCKNAIFFYWQLTIVPIAASFHILGGIANKREFLKNNITIAIISFLLGVIISQYYQIDFYNNKIENILFVYIAACCGIYSLIVFSSVISNISLSKFLSFIGRNTLIIVGFSLPIMRIIISLLNNVSLPKMFLIPLRQLLMWIILYLLIQLFLRYPFVFGKIDLKKLRR